MARDALDTARAVAPLAEAPDAVRVDTTTLDFQAQVETLVRLALDRAAQG